MPENNPASLGELLAGAPGLSQRFFHGPHASVPLGEIAAGSIFGGRLADAAGRSVILRTRDQFTAALALIELDGIARRITLCPPDVKLEHLPTLAAQAGADMIAGDIAPDGVLGAVPHLSAVAPAPAPALRRSCRTEWLLLTSGTAGVPKIVQHSLASLMGAIKARNAFDPSIVWGTFYDMRRYGGLQIFFRALLSGGSFVLSGAGEKVPDFLARLGAHGVSHLTGTPSHWRRVLMCPANGLIAPRYVRLSGEIADQAVLDGLRELYPEAGIGHAFASTEAGVAFEVNDMREGFPADFLGIDGREVAMKVEDGSLRIRSARMASNYVGREDEALHDSEGFVDTGDLVERRAERYYFLGRRGGIVNVGGLKVHPEEVEAVINRHGDVRMSLVRARKNPFTGAVVVADVALKAPEQVPDYRARIEHEILEICRAALPEHKIPAIIRFVPSLDVGPSGKLVRPHA